MEHELATTRRVLERVPDDHFAWKPHTKSMAMGEFASHIANIPNWATITATDTELDFATLPPPSAFENRIAVLAAFDVPAIYGPSADESGR